MRNYCRTIALVAAVGFVGAGCAPRPPERPYDGGHSPGASREMLAAWRQGRYQYPAAMAYVRHAGMPVSLSELKRPLPAPARNAAILYMRFAAALKAHPLGGDEKFLADFVQRPEPSAADIARMRQLLTRRADLLATAKEAAGRPECVFVRDWDNPNPRKINFPELPLMRFAVRLLLAESLLRAHDNGPIDAVKEASLGFAIARHCESDRTLNAFLVAEGVDRLTLSALQRIVIEHADRPDVARAALDSLAHNWRSRSLAAPMRTEVAFQAATLELVRRGGPSALDGLTSGGDGETAGKKGKSGRPDLPQLNPADWAAFVDANALYILRQMPGMVATADQPYTQAVPAMRAVYDDATRPGASDIHNSSTRILAATLFPEPVYLLDTRARVDARAQLLQAGASALIYRAKHHRPPNTLTDAIKPAPTDPFNDKPLRYRRDGDGFVLSSVSAGPHPSRAEKGRLEFRIPDR